MLCITNVKDNHHSVKHYQRAIAEAQKQLGLSMKRTKRLREVIADLQRLKDAGQPWPGTAHSTSQSESAATRNWISTRFPISGIDATLELQLFRTVRFSIRFSYAVPWMMRFT